MATCRVICSGSKGNCYILKTEKESLILELGCKWNDILRALNYEIAKVVGVLVSHSHR